MFAEKVTQRAEKTLDCAINVLLGCVDNSLSSVEFNISKKKGQSNPVYSQMESAHAVHKSTGLWPCQATPR